MCSNWSMCCCLWTTSVAPDNGAGGCPSVSRMKVAQAVSQEGGEGRGSGPSADCTYAPTCHETDSSYDNWAGIHSPMVASPLHTESGLQRVWRNSQTRGRGGERKRRRGGGE